MNDNKFSCVDCKVRVCGDKKFNEETHYPAFCPTPGLQEGQVQGEVLAEAMELYNEGRNREIMVAAAEVESEGYCVWPRVEEIMRFAEKLGAKKIGIATCVGLLNEASLFADILRARGFEPVGIGCKAGSQLKTDMGVSPEHCDVGEVMCNPILQAKKLEAEGTDLNVVVGLCVGHDSLFYKYSAAPATTLITKDRVTGHNPAGPLYTSKSYYKKLSRKPE
jgi:uncharacterized metal-binding protein